MNDYIEDEEFNMYIQVELINVVKNNKICFDDLKEFKIDSHNRIWLKFIDGFSTIYKFTVIEYEIKRDFSYYPHVIRIYTEEV